MKSFRIQITCTEALNFSSITSTTVAPQALSARLPGPAVKPQWHPMPRRIDISGGFPEGSFAPYPCAMCLQHNGRIQKKTLMIYTSLQIIIAAVSTKISLHFVKCSSTSCDTRSTINATNSTGWMPRGIVATPALEKKNWSSKAKLIAAPAWQKWINLNLKRHNVQIWTMYTLYLPNSTPSGLWRTEDTRLRLVPQNNSWLWYGLSEAKLQDNCSTTASTCIKRIKVGK